MPEWEYRIAGCVQAVRAGELPTRPIENLMAELGYTQAEIDAAPDDGF